MSIPNKRAYHRAYMAAKCSLRSIPENYQHPHFVENLSDDENNVHDNENGNDNNENVFIEGKYYISKGELNLINYLNR